MKVSIKTGDTVLVNSGKDSGKKGKVLAIRKTKNGVRGKALFESGKKIGYQGLTFYTEDKVNEDDDYWLTEETSGTGGSFAHIKARFELCIKAITKSPKINELPLAVKNKKGEWEIVESEENE